MCVALWNEFSSCSFAVSCKSYFLPIPLLQFGATFSNATLRDFVVYYVLQRPPSSFPPRVSVQRGVRDRGPFVRLVFSAFIPLLPMGTLASAGIVKRTRAPQKRPFFLRGECHTFSRTKKTPLPLKKNAVGVKGWGNEKECEIRQFLHEILSHNFVGCYLP